MIAQTYSEQMDLIEELLEQMRHDVPDDTELLRRVEGWMTRLGTQRHFTTMVHRSVERLVQVLETRPTPEAVEIARAGMVFLLRTGGEPETLSEMAIQAHAFILNNIVDKTGEALSVQ